MRHAGWILAAFAAVFVVGFLAALALTDHVHQQEVIRAQATTTAAATITTFLVAVIAGLLLITVVAVSVWLWLKRRQERARLDAVLRQAQIYALLCAQRLPGRPAHLSGLPQQAGGNVFVFPNGGPPATSLHPEDIRALLGEPPEPMTGLLPPDEGGWL